MQTRLRASLFRQDRHDVAQNIVAIERRPKIRMKVLPQSIIMLAVNHRVGAKRENRER